MKVHPKKRSTVSAIARQAAVWGFSAGYLPALVLSCSVIGRDARSSWAPKMSRGWGQAALFLAGVKLEFTERARHALSARKPRVLTFNHASTLDVLVGAGLLPDGGVLALKKEMRDLPLLGSACAAMGSIVLDRGNRERAYASLKESGSRIQEERLQVLISPEGTRSDDGSLGRFKLGAFHLAAAAEVPILPIVLHGYADIWPRRELAPRPGTAVVDVLPEYVLTSTEPETLRVAADSLREAYQDALKLGPPATNPKRST